MKISLELVPVKMRLPLKFGAETIDSIKIAHVELDAYGAKPVFFSEGVLGNTAWGK